VRFGGSDVGALTSGAAPLSRELRLLQTLPCAANWLVLYCRGNDAASERDKGSGQSKEGDIMLDPVGSLLKAKGHAVHTVTPSEMVSVAVRKMTQSEIGALPVIEHGKLVGIFSERDVLIRIVDQGLDPDTTPVGDVMTPSPKSITSSQEVREAMRLMSKGRFRHLPVVDGDALVGLISIRDAMAWVIRDQEQVIDELISTVRLAPPIHRVRG
jgi:CBS domain-containing protein